MRRLVPISLPTLLCFCLMSSNNVKSQNEKRYWAAKAVAHTSIRLGKRESDFYKNVWCPKSQRFVHQIEISKISGIDLKKRCKDKKWSNVINCKEAKWKASKICNYFLVGGHICSFLYLRLTTWLSTSCVWFDWIDHWSFTLD